MSVNYSVLCIDLIRSNATIEDVWRLQFQVRTRNENSYITGPHALCSHYRGPDGTVPSPYMVYASPTTARATCRRTDTSYTQPLLQTSARGAFTALNCVAFTARTGHSVITAKQSPHSAHVTECGDCSGIIATWPQQPAELPQSHRVVTTRGAC